MILTEIYRNVDDIPDIESCHIETAMVKSDDLHGNDYGIRLEDENQVLESGSAFKIGEKRLLVISVIPDEMIVVKPKNIDEMGVIAHLLGNLHKPVQVKDGTISLLLDKVVVNTLDKRHADYEIKQIKLDEPLKYADLTNGK